MPPRFRKPLFSIVATITVFAAAIGPALSNHTIAREAVDLQDEGTTALERGDLQGAAAKFEAALKKDPQYWLAAESFSKLLNTLGGQVKNDPAAALEKFHKALFFNKDNAKAASNITEQLRLMGKNPDSFEDREQMADVLMAKGDYIGAMIEYEAALAIRDDQALKEKLEAASREAGERPLSRNRVNFTPYMLALQKRIKSQWRPPKNYCSRNVLVSFNIDRAGKVSNLTLAKSCGAPEQDQAALATIERAAPFAALPEGSPAHVTISFTFDYNVFRNVLAGDNPVYFPGPEAESEKQLQLENKLKKDIADQEVGAEKSDENAQKSLIAALNALAVFYLNQNRLVDAGPLLTRAKSLAEKLTVSASLMQAFTLSNLGQLYYLQNKFEDSETLLKQSLDVAAKDPVGNQKIIVHAQQIYVLLLLKMKRTDEARKLQTTVNNLKESQDEGLLAAGAEGRSASKQTSSEAIDCVRRASDYCRHHQYDSALQNCNQAIALSPKYAYAYCCRGNVHAGLSQFDLAFADYTEAIKLDPKLFLAYVNRGWLHGRLQQLDSAIADDTQALLLSPKLAKVYCNRGKAYRQKGDLNRALADLARCIALNPASEDAYTERGIIYHNQMRDDAALNQYKLALTINPIWEWAYVDRGNVYDSQKQYDLAMTDYNQAIALNPRSALFYHIRGNCNYHAKYYDKAIPDYSAAIELEPHSLDHLLQRGRCYHYAHNYEKALEDFKLALAIKPNDQDTLVARGNTFAKMKQQEKALDNYNQALVVNPKSPIIYRNIGIAYSALKDQQKAIANFDKAIELDPNYAGAYVSRGYAYQSLEQYSRAIEDFDLAIKLDPNDPNAYINRGFAYSKLKKAQPFFDDCNEAIRLDPHSAIAYVNRSYSNVCLGHYQQAYDDACQAIALNPDLAAGYCNRGKAEYKLERFDDALKDLTRSIELDAKVCDASAFCYRSFVYRKLSKPELAEEDLSKAKELGYDRENKMDAP